MTPEREARDISETPAGTKHALLLQLSIQEVVNRLISELNKGNLNAACKFITDVLYARDWEYIAVSNKFSKLKIQLKELQKTQDDANVDSESLRKHNSILTHALGDIVKQYNKPYDVHDTPNKCKNVMHLDAAKAGDDSHHPNEHVNKAQDLCMSLAKEITALGDATKNADLAGSGSNNAAVDVGRANTSPELPSYFLDRDIAQTIVDYYEQRVDQSVQELYDHLKHPKQDQGRDTV